MGLVRMEKRTPFYAFAKVVVQPVLNLIFPCKKQGAEKLPESGRVIVCSNHLGMKDPILLAMVLKRQLFYMAKAELFKNKFVAMIIRSLGAFPVARGKHDTGAIDYAAKLLSEDRVVGIFIEGTRSKDGNLGKPKSGAAMLAYQNNAPVLPMCITTKDGKSPRIFRKTVVSCGDLIPVEKLGIKEGSGPEFRQASRYIMEQIAQLRERDQKFFEKE